MEEKLAPKKPHSIVLDSRKLLTATGVSNVDSFDEQTVVAYTDYGELVISGSGLKIEKLSVETGELTVRGDIAALAYSENRPAGSVFSRIFK